MAGTNRFIPLFSSQSGAVPTASQMEDGELAINTADGRLFTKQGNQIITLAGHIQVSSSWAATASWVPNLYPAGAIPIMSGGGVVVQDPLALNFLGSGVSVTNTANTASITIVSGAADWNNLSNKPVGLVSSSVQYSTGSYTGSFTGSLLGSGTYALSASAATSLTFTPTTASYALSASAATSITFLPASASYAGTTWNAINNKPTVVSASSQVATGSYTGSFTGSLLGSASFASTTWTSVNNKPTVVSASAQINTGSFTGSFTGSLLGSASYALSSSAATSITFLPASASYANATTWNAINNKPIVFSSSAQLPAGTVSSSVQINTGSFTGSFTGSLLGSASYALTSSYAMNGGSGGVSSSYATTSSYASYAVTSSYFSGSANFANGLLVTGSVTASAYTGSLTGSLLGSASYALTSSYAMNGGSGGVSSSYAITSSYATIAQNVLGSITSASYASTASLLLGSVQSSSWSAYAVTASYFSASADFPNGLVVTGSVTASAYTGSGAGIIGVISSSYSLTASYAMNSGLGGVSSSYALTASYAMNGGSGGVSSSYATTSSFASKAALATTATTASYVTGTISFPNGLVVTGSVTASAYTGSYTGSLLGSASWALTASYAAAFSGSIANAISSSYSTYAVTASYISGGLDLSSGLIVTGTVTATAFVGTGSGIVGVVSSSYARTASYAMNGGSGGVSSSYATTSSFASTARSASYATLAQNVLGSITSASYALTASFATIAITASYFSGTVDFTNGMTVTGSTISTQGFTGSLSGTANLAVSSSYALTASYAMNGGSGGVSSSYATTSSFASTARSASFATTSITASYFSTSVNFPAGLDVTGTLVTTTGVTILRSGTLSLEATVTNNPIGILALTGTLPFTKLYNTGSSNTTMQIPSGTVTGSIFELVYSNMNSSTRNIMFPNVRVKDSVSTAPTWSVANSASVFFQFRYLPNFSASTTVMYWMPMFTQSIS